MIGTQLDSELEARNTSQNVGEQVKDALQRSSALKTPTHSSALFNCGKELLPENGGRGIVFATELSSPRNLDLKMAMSAPGSIAGRNEFVLSPTS